MTTGQVKVPPALPASSIEPSMAQLSTTTLALASTSPMSSTVPSMVPVPIPTPVTVPVSVPSTSTVNSTSPDRGVPAHRASTVPS